jgi:putative transcriptional regulator
LLVATPLLADPNFERTVVLLLTHGDDGAFGVVLNRPSGTEVLELVPGWAGAAAEPSLMYLGGPVGQSAVVGLGVVEGEPPGEELPGWQRVVGPVGTIDLNLDPADVATPLAGVRLFAGSAGWISGQLEGEIDEEAWWVLDSEPGDVVSSEPAGLWEHVLRRQPQPTSFFAVFPPDPLVN